MDGIEYVLLDLMIVGAVVGFIPFCLFDAIVLRLIAPRLLKQRITFGRAFLCIILGMIVCGLMLVLVLVLVWGGGLDSNG